MTTWPKDITIWQEGRTGFMSIPFTWLLPRAKWLIRQGDLWVDRWIVGGPAVKLLPDYLRGLAEYGPDDPSVIQRVHPQATRTTAGCPRSCAFCGVRRICGEFRELDGWPNLPILIDDNLLAASPMHFIRVLAKLQHEWEGVDFNQGLDCRLLTAFHAKWLALLTKPTIRLALDHDSERQAWADALDRMLTAGIARSRIRSLVLCGFDGGPQEDRDRCEYVESFGVKALPMWYHRLDSMRQNEVTEEQRSLGWTHEKSRELMCWYYWHRTLETRG